MRFSYLATLAPLATLAVAEAVNEEKVSYDGYKVFRIDTGDNATSVLESLADLDYDQWNADASRHLDISIPGDAVAAFEALNLQYTVMHEDLGASIALESPEASGLVERQTNWFASYHTYAEHVQWWRDQQAGFSANSALFNAGRSVAGRDIFGLRLFGQRVAGQSRPAAVILGHVHAREWISGMTVEYIADELIRGYRSGEANARRILDSYDVYIVPFVNPDGFVFSTTTNRLWRKNRSQPPAGSNCFGVDLNRNFPIRWGQVRGGSSADPCAQTYRGRAAGDQPELQGIKTFIDNVSRNQGLKIFLDVHSYGQYILSPWGYTCTGTPPNHQKHISLANGAAAAIRAPYGTPYTVGGACSTLYATDGSSTDYAYDVARAELSYCYELRDRGNNGFVLPASEIIPSGIETYAGVRHMLLNM